MCLAAAQQARVNRVVYSAGDPKGGALSLGYSLHQDSRMNHRFQVDRMDVPICGQILTEFFKKKAKSRLKMISPEFDETYFGAVFYCHFVYGF